MPPFDCCDGYERTGRPEVSASIVRWAGLAAMFGGALFVVSAVVISSMPRGCIGDECGTRPVRETGAAGALLMLALVVGFVLLGIAVLLAGVLPRWSAVLLVVGSLAMLGFNDQNAQAFLAIPNDIAWVAAGYVLWSGGDGSTRRRRRAPR
jgi:hypothetical protein